MTPMPKECHHSAAFAATMAARWRWAFFGHVIRVRFENAVLEIALSPFRDGLPDWVNSTYRGTSAGSLLMVEELPQLGRDRRRRCS